MWYLYVFMIIDEYIRSPKPSLTLSDPFCRTLNMGNLTEFERAGPVKQDPQASGHSLQEQS
jgi:hypothetical protein